MTAGGRAWLMVAGSLSAMAALLHLACIVGGGDWYRFFGAGEDMARAAELGLIFPAVLTAVIAIVLAVWAAYAWSAAGLIGRLPLLRTALILISMIYLARGLALLPIIVFYPHARAVMGPFEYWSSGTVLLFGIT